MICWVDSRLAKFGKRVRDDDGHVWKVEEIYVTWPKSKLDAQRNWLVKMQEVLR
jgi:hypothetical protein